MVAIWLLAPFLAGSPSASMLPEQLIGHGGPIKSIAISADGLRALTASFDYSVIYWDLSGENGQIIHRLLGHDGAVNDAAFMPDQQRAVSVGDDGMLGIWDLNTGRMIGRVMSEPQKVLDVAVSADGQIAATARWDGTARLYDLREMKEIAILRGHRGNVNAVAFSPDMRSLYTAGYDGAIIQWDVETARHVRHLHRHGWGVNTIAVAGTDRVVFGALDGTVGLIELEHSNRAIELALRDRPVQSVKVSHDGALISYGDGSGMIEVFAASTVSRLEGTQVSLGPVWDFDFVPGTSQIYHVGLDDFASRWQISPRRMEQIKGEFPRRFQVRDRDDPGELEFLRKCSICHTLEPDDANRAGPTLYGIFGRRAGTLPGYPYSEALQNTDIVWNEETIGRLFDDGPDVVVPGTKMPIQRLKSVGRRDELIRFLKKATVPIK